MTNKVVSAWMNQDHLTRLDTLRNDIPRSKALTKILDYILSQDDAWIKDLIGVPSPAIETTQQDSAITQAQVI